MKSVYWLSRPSFGIGNGLGYATHNSKMYEYTKKYIDCDDPYADMFFQITPADFFKPVPNKLNGLMTMFEMVGVPDNYKPALREADYVFVPCKFSADLFSPYTKREPIIIHEGIEPKDFPYYQRREPNYSKGERFRIYWNGAPNPRKGYQYMVHLIKNADNTPDVEYYVKTTMPKSNPLILQENAKEALKRDTLTEKERVNLERIASGEDTDKFYEFYSKAEQVKYYGKHKNVIFDTRRVSSQELTELYNKAHVFLFPSQGEGWGLMGCEALGTGCPVIAPRHTGIAEYFDAQVGYPIGFTTSPVRASNYDLTADVFVPYLDDIYKQLEYVKSHYREALERGRAGSRRMRSRFTWDIQGQKLASILKKI